MDEPKPELLDPRQGAQVLAHHIPFIGLDQASLESIYSQGELLRIPQHSNIIVEGENSSGMYVLLEGLAGVYKSEADNRKGTLIKSLTQGEAFGEMSLVDPAPRSATVAAEVDVFVFYLSSDAFEEAVTSDPHLGLQLFQNFAQDMSKRLRALNEDLIVSQRQLWRLAFSRGEREILDVKQKLGGREKGAEAASDR